MDREALSDGKRRIQQITPSSGREAFAGAAIGTGLLAVAEAINNLAEAISARDAKKAPEAKS